MKLPGSPSQQRALFYVLLSACLGIWGYVIYRTAGGGHQEAALTLSPVAVMTAQRPASAPHEIDTAIHYNASFRDPFALPATMFALPPKTAGKQAKQARQPPTTVPQLPPLILNGIIGKTALLLEEGTVHIGRVGEQAGGVQILTVERDHIVVQCEGRSHILQLRP